MNTKSFLISSLTVIACLLYNPSNAQNVGINATGARPDTSAGLDISFNNRGLLIPRVSLSSTTDNATIPYPATSLLVYNSGTVLPKGYYYNVGSPTSPKWVKFLTSDSPSSDAWLTNGNSGTTPGTHFIGTTDNADLVFKMNNTERVRITTLGRVGIGTNSPIAQLHVHSGGSTAAVISANMPSDGTNASARIELRNSATGSHWILYHADPDGYFGVGPRNLELWEYPNDNSGSCCRVRFVIENTYGISPWTGGTWLPVTIHNNGHVSAYGYTTVSDISTKENIEDLSYGLNEVLHIQPLFFKYKGTNKRRVGFIAQELKNFIPEVVDTLRNDDKGILLGVDYGEISAVLVRAIQDQQKIINSQQEVIKAQQEEINNLKVNYQEEVGKLKAELHELKAFFLKE